MKKYLPFILFACVITFTFTSCKKSSSTDTPGSYYMKANFDGSVKTFNNTVAAIKAELGNGYYSLIITGIGSTEQLSLMLWSDKDDYTAGKTFTVEALGGTTYNFLAYAAPLGNSDPMSQWTTIYDYASVTQSFQCTITEATSAYIKGTFSSVIYQDNSSKVVSKTVTGGEFYAKY